VIIVLHRLWERIIKKFPYLLNFRRNIYGNSKNTMNQLINLSGDYVTFDVGNKKSQKVKIVGTFKQPYFCGIINM